MEGEKKQPRLHRWENFHVEGEIISEKVVSTRTSGHLPYPLFLWKKGEIPALICPDMRIQIDDLCTSGFNALEASSSNISHVCFYYSLLFIMIKGNGGFFFQLPKSQFVQSPVPRPSGRRTSSCWFCQEALNSYPSTASPKNTISQSCLLPRIARDKFSSVYQHYFVHGILIKVSNNMFLKYYFQGALGERNQFPIKYLLAENASVEDAAQCHPYKTNLYLILM